MEEKELFDRLIAIRDEANEHGRYRIARMTNQLILDRWGTTKVQFAEVKQTPINTLNSKENDSGFKLN